MATPQLENGYTRLANELLEALSCAGLPGARHYEVMLAMIRLIYGYNRTEDRIASSQVAAMTGLDVRNVRSLLSDLVRLGLLECEGAAGRTPLYRIQKDYEKWHRSGRQRRGLSTTRVDGGRSGCPQPGGRVAHNPGSRVAHNPDQRKKDSSPKTEETGAPDRKRSPLLNLIAKRDGSPREKELWFEEVAPQIEVDALASRHTDKPQTQAQLVVRYYRAYLRRPEREFRAKAELEERRAKVDAWRERTDPEREAAIAAAEAEERRAPVTADLWDQLKLEGAIRV